MIDQILLIGSTVLSVAAMIVACIAPLGLFKSRRQREVEAKLKRALNHPSVTP